MSSDYCVSFNEMASIDKKTQEDYLIPALLLMENAGRLSWEKIKSFEQTVFQKPLLLVIGKGNNGGDGLVIARHALNDNHLNIHLLFTNEVKTSESKRNLEMLKKLKVPIYSFSKKQDEIKLKNIFSKSPAILIDAFLGIGIKQPLKISAQVIISWINQLKKINPYLKIISLDIPSGLSYLANPKMVVQANTTLTYGLYKDVLFFPHYNPLVGKIIKINPGFPHPLLENKKYSCNQLLKMENSPLKFEFKSNDYKKTRGRVLVVGGSPGLLGAPILASLAAEKTGAGLISLLSRKEDYPFQVKKNNRLMIQIINNNLDFKQIDCLLIGPGWGRNFKDPEIKLFLTSLFKKLASEKLNFPIIIDADGIYWYKKYQKEFLILGPTTPLILTPHLGEFAHLIDKTILQINNNPYHWGKVSGQKLNAHIVLKAQVSYIFKPKSIKNEEETITLNYTNPYLGVGGSGDVLAGIIAGLLAHYWVHKKKDLNDILKTSLLLHSLSGQRSHEKKHIFNAEELIDEIPQAIKFLS